MSEKTQTTTQKPMPPQESTSGESSKQTPKTQYREPQESLSIRQNFSDEAETLINELINNILFGCYTCTSMAYYFDRVDVGLFGMADFFRWCGREAYQRSRLLMDYIVVRGGEVEFDTVKKPEKTEWGTPLEALKYLIEFKKTINQQVLKVHNQACEQIDPHLTDFLETTVLRPLVESIRKFSVLAANLERAGSKLGSYQFNKDLELHLQQIMRETKISHAQLPVTAVGAPLPIGTSYSPAEPLNYMPSWGVGPTSGPNFNLADIVHLVANFGLGGGTPTGMGRSRII